jgi:hypothetical protein
LRGKQATIIAVAAVGIHGMDVSYNISTLIQMTG